MSMLTMNASTFLGIAVQKIDVIFQIDVKKRNSEHDLTLLYSILVSDRQSDHLCATKTTVITII
jgi:hypothetical protein